MYNVYNLWFPIKSEEINQREVQNDMEAPAVACANWKASVADYKLICILGGLQLIIPKLPPYSDPRTLVGVPNISPQAPKWSIFLMLATSKTLSTGKLTSLFCLKLHEHTRSFTFETQKRFKLSSYIHHTSLTRKGCVCVISQDLNISMPQSRAVTLNI